MKLNTESGISERRKRALIRGIINYTIIKYPNEKVRDIRLANVFTDELFRAIDLIMEDERHET